MSVSTLLRSASSISAAPASTTSAADIGNSTSLPRSSSCRRTISSTNPSIAGASADRGDCRRRVVPNRENRIETADRKHVAHAGGKPEQGQLALRLLHFSGNEQQHAQSGAADILELRQVDHEARGAVCNQPCQLFLGGCGRTAVQAAGEFRDHDVARVFMGKFHRVPSPSNVIDHASYHADKVIVNRSTPTLRASGAIRKEFGGGLGFQSGLA